MADELRREVQVDTALAELHGRLAKARLDLAATKLSLARFAGADVIYETRDRRVVRETADELIETVESLLAEERIPRYDEERAARTIKNYRDLLAQSRAILAEMEPLNAEFAANPWSRFFLVQNHGGHIHSSMQCSTCRPSTSFGWLPALSGLTEKDAVEEHGPLLCTVCYPSAPVEWTRGLPEADDRCAGSGAYQSHPNRRRYLACEVCGKHVSVTSTGKLRSHKAAV